MRDAVAIVAPAVDLGQIERELQREIIAMQDADRAEVAAVERVEKTAETARRQRLVVGQRLVEAKRAVKHGQWSTFIERIGIVSQRASELMRLAGFVESKSPPSQNSGDLNVPTFAEAGIKPRKRDEESTPVNVDEPAQNWQREIESRRSQAHGVKAEPDPLAALSRFIDQLRQVAKQTNAFYRKQMAHELRETARALEEMK